MANTFLTTKNIARQILPRLIDNLVAPNLFYKDYSDAFAKQGDTIRVRKPVVLTANDFTAGTPVTEQDVEEDSVDVTLDKIAKLTDLTTVELDADGKVKDADKLVASLKTEWADFVGAPTDTGVPTTNPPPTDGETDTDKMDDAAYYAYIAQQKKG